MNPDPATRVIRWGILGTGTVARAFATDLRLLPDARLTSIGSRKLDRARVFASEFGARHVHESLEYFARDDDVDVVYVATPHVRHREDCMACLAGGRAILCEKPFTLNVAEARAVIDQARASRRFCMEAMWMRFHPLILKVRSMVESGALGAIRLLTADFGYAASFDPENRLFDRRLGGGALLDRGIYPLSLASFLLGRPIESVGRATLGPTGVDEQLAMLLSYPGGTLAVLTASLRSQTKNEAVIIGTHGQIRLHSPFYAPNRMSWTRFTEPVGATLAERSSATGWKARVKRNPLVRRALDVGGRSLLSLIPRDTTSFVHYAPGQGYQFKAAEVMRCLRLGLLESPVMPLDETLAILETSDALRRSWALTYPGEN